MSVILSREDGEGSPGHMRRGLLTALGMTLLAPLLFAGSQAVGSRAAIATSSRYATQTGLQVLRRGGNAADAAVAVAFVLSVVQPGTASIGGGGTLVYYDAKSNAVWTLDFRENAPAAFKGGAPRGGVAGAGVPSTVAGMDELHRRFGSLPWRDLVAPASASAKGDLAKTLHLIATSGARVFYDGAISARIVDEVRKAGGSLSLHDLSEYKPLWRSPIQTTFGEYEIASVAPPAAGGMMIAEMLSIAGSSEPTVHLLAEAERRAAYDRDRFFADNSILSYRDVLSADHAKQWRASIDPARATPTIALGEHVAAMAQSIHTTHFTIVDAERNVAAVTVSLDDDNGTGFVVPGCGFPLNDAAKNATHAGDRIPSSMAPTIVLRGGKPVLAIGSAGGTMTPAIVLQVILNITRYNKSLNDAVEAPRFDQQATPDDITYEATRTAPEVVARLTAMGHGMRATDSIGDVNAVLIETGRLTAVSDSRHAGVAGGM